MRKSSNYVKPLKINELLDNDKYIIEGEVIGTGGSFDGDTSYPIRYDIELRIRKK